MFGFFLCLFFYFFLSVFYCFTFCINFFIYNFINLLLFLFIFLSFFSLNFIAITQGLASLYVTAFIGDRFCFMNLSCNTKHWVQHSMFCVVPESWDRWRCVYSIHCLIVHKKQTCTRDPNVVQYSKMVHSPELHHNLVTTQAQCTNTIEKYDSQQWLRFIVFLNPNKLVLWGRVSRFGFLLYGNILQYDIATAQAAEITCTEGTVDFLPC